MPTNNFDNRLGEVLQVDEKSDPYLQAFDSIQNVARSIESWIGAANTKVEVEPGFQGRIGQQLNIVVKIPSKNVDDALFRAYVTPSGKISLDLYDDDPLPCANEAEMEDRVLEFMARPEVRSRLNIYRKITS